MKQKTIKQKLSVYNIILFLLSLSIAVITNAGTVKVLRNYDDFTNQYSELNEFYKNMEQADGAAQAYLYSNDADNLNQFYEKSAACYENLRVLCNTTENPDLLWKYSRLRNMVDSYSEIFQEIGIDKINRDKKYEFFSRINSNIQRTYIEYSSLISIEMNETRQMMAGELKKQLIITILFAAVMTVSAGLFGVIASRSIAQPIGQIIKNISGIRKGDYQVSAITGANTFEIGILNDAVKELGEEIQNSIQHMWDKAHLENQLLEKENENLKMNELLIQTELKVLQGQMNPHFLFNTLSLISKMAYLEGAVKTCELMETTSDLLRYSLNKSNSISDLNSEIECVRNYIKIQETRFGNRIRFELKIDDVLPELYMPGMIVQPLVENAVMHGVRNVMEGAAVTISVLSDRNKVYVMVEDNGEGMDSQRLEEVQAGTKENSIGIANVKKRLDMFFGGRQILIIESAPQCGTAVTIVLPITCESEENYEPVDDSGR